MQNYYNILGVNENASQDQIKKAFRKASLKNHPDRGGSKEEFQNINSAYQILGDPEKKRHYDNQRRNPFMNNGVFNARNGSADDIFKMFFGSQNGMPFGFPGGPNVQIFQNGRPVNLNRQRKPTPITKTVTITIEEAYEGINKPIEIERWIHANGIKKVEKEKIYIPIPAGIDNQEIIILKDKGNVINENITGDIKIFVNVDNKSDFVRDGLNLIYKKNISLKESLIGFKFDLVHLSGKTYCINNYNGKIITPQYTKVIKNMGMRRTKPHPAPPIVGNLLIVFDVEFPTDLTKDQKKTISECL